MYDKFKTYEKNHDISNVKETELNKIFLERHKLNKKQRKMKKHKYHDVIDLDEKSEDTLQNEYYILKTKRNIKTRKQRLKNFKENEHID